MSNAVQVTRKILSNGLSTVLLTIYGEEGMVIPEVEKTLGIPKQTILDHVKSNGFELVRVSGEIRKSLVAEKVINIGAGRPPRFISRKAIESLVRFISTAKTDAIYSQLWDVAKAVQSGDLAKAQATVGLSDDEALNHLEQALTLARKFKVERDQEIIRADNAEASALTSAKMVATATQALEDLKADVVDIALLLHERLNRHFRSVNYEWSPMIAYRRCLFLKAGGLD